jgi:hypothetical protein
MAEVTITISDTPTGVAIKSNFTPAVGARCSAAQAAALDIIRRTSREYGLLASSSTPAPAADTSTTDFPKA